MNRYFKAHGTGYMVMDYEDGESAQDLAGRNPLPAEDALKALLAPLLDGLDKVHASRVPAPRHQARQHLRARGRRRRC